MLQQPRLRGLASTDYSENHPELEDNSEDFDSIDIDGHDEVYSFYESEDEDEYKEDSFAASTFRPVRPLARKCFRWHDSAACRGGGRAGYCARGWIPKCIYCKRGEEADSMTGECVSSGGGDGKVEHCFRWHDDAGCRGGSRAGRCIRGWNEKCIYCERDEEADKKTGKCVSSGDDEKVEQCFRWHDDAFCRRGSRSGRCIRGWTDKCIMCSQDKKVNKVTGECERNELFIKEA